ncbi:MAG: hypothetical protein Q8R16_00100, partial [bacterium]|nr:hypothetical protein [bacterium]
KKGFCDAAEAQRIADRYEELMKAISGFVRYLRQRSLVETQSLTSRPPPSHSLPPRPPKAGLPPRAL